MKEGDRQMFFKNFSKKIFRNKIVLVIFKKKTTLKFTATM